MHIAFFYYREMHSMEMFGFTIDSVKVFPTVNIVYVMQLQILKGASSVDEYYFSLSSIVDLKCCCLRFRFIAYAK